MQKKKVDSNVYHIRSSLGLQETKLMYPAWDITIQVDKPIFVMNLYRKVTMKELGQYRLQISSMEKDDPYLMQDMIEKRISQITISQENEQDEFELFCENNIDQEMLVSTDHIRWRVNGQLKSAIEDRKLCDKVPLFRLGIGRYIRMSIKKKKLQSCINDVYRPLMVAFKDGQITADHFQHDTIYKSLYIMWYGAIKNVKLFNQQASDIVHSIIKKQQLQLEINFDLRFDCYVVMFRDMPSYMLDTILCYIHKDLLTIFKQIKPNTVQSTQPSVLMILSNTENTEEVLVKVKSLFQKALSLLLKDFDEISNSVTNACQE